MKTKAVRLYGEMDIRLEEFELPDMKEDEILAEVVTDSLCMSSYKAVNQGKRHKKVPENIENHPIILGHEFCGRILKVGEKWKKEYQPGDKFVIQPNIGDIRGYAPGYSYQYMGGDATKIIFSNQVMENGSLLKYHGDTFFEGSLVEPLSCVIGAFHAQYHLKKMYSYEHIMGIRENGSMALLGATGPMGFLAIDYAIHGPKKPSVLVVTGRTQKKLDMAEKLYPVNEAEKNGVKLFYVNTGEIENIAEYLRKFSIEEKGFDDVMIFAPNKDMVSYGTEMLAYDGCLNFFAGPADKTFSSEVNFYDVHYNATHFVGSSGGNTEDMKQSIQLIESKTVDASKIVTHVLGLDFAAEITKKLPLIGGGKKIVYTQHKCPMFEVDKIDEISDNEFSMNLKQILEKNGYLWSVEAERYFMNEAPDI